MKSSTLLLCILILISCSSNDSRLEQALDFAGENRAELEKVLLHYEDSPEKLEAARFLIRNMPRWYAYEGWQLDSIKPVLIKKSRREPVSKKIIEKWKNFSFYSLPKAYDAHVITADFLIENIDLAFDVWKRYPWNRNLCFDDFCELILPYRIENEPLSTWRKLYHDYYTAILDSAYHGDDVIEACKVIDKELKERYYVWDTDFNMPHINGCFLFHYRVGFCREACDITLYAMRAAGIPTATDFFAYSPEYQRSHYWTSLRDTTGQYIQFGFNEFEATRNERRTDGRKKGKVYRFCFGVQQEIFPGITYNNKIPGLFRNRFIKDVTEHYFGHNEVYVPIQSTGKKFIYLGVFSPEKWIPIDITPGGKATVKFHNIEPDIIYQPLFSDGKSHHAAGFPFIYIANNIHILKPDTTNMEEVALKRKMSLVNSFLLRLHKPIIGSKVEASQDPSFSTPDLLYLFKDTLTYNLYKLTPYKINKKYRYVRYLSPPGEEMELSEISFYKDSLCTESIPLKRINNIQPQKTLENITDGDILTYFSSEDTSCYVSYDMGKPVNIRKIMFSPRNDDNFIWPDDKYELLYQNGINGWVSLGTKTATGKEINFRAPKNALLWLRNKTKGREEQVFVYKNGKQYFTIDIDSSFL